MMQSLHTQMRLAAAVAAAMLAFAATARAEEATPSDEPPTIEHLLKSGWQVAGYASNCDTRFDVHPVQAPDRTPCRSMPRRLRRDAHAAHFRELLSAEVSARGAYRLPSSSVE